VCRMIVNYRTVTGCSFIVLLTVFSVLILSGHVVATIHGISSQRIHYSSVNEPLKKFLDDIESQSSWTIHIEDGWDTAPVSLILEDVSIEEGLKRAFKQLGLNYALTIDYEQNDIRVFIVAGSALKKSVGSSKPDMSASISQSRQTAVPPEKGNMSPPSEDELSKISAKSSADLLDYSAVPPEKDGQPGITEREIRILRDSRGQEHVDLSPVPDEKIRKK